ncbi:adapter protein MecA 1/2 [Granulicatella balaenopterae]|uniref:Adapter protein MecA 1/2 n=2 Tax=Granulicatella balaenopterae TaxID=137733 RepID=A0A1H9H5Q4_9LACT|nr:adapter protein MecA 1/2 [Granulicatella balaenopterae]
MEMEHINENTVLIRVANQDLIDRGVNLVDLFTNPTQVEPFFHGLLEELDLLDFFEETEALTFQVMPNTEGLEIYVSESIRLRPPTANDKDTDDPNEDFINQLSDVLGANEIDILDLIGGNANQTLEDSEEDDSQEYEFDDEEIIQEDIVKTVIFNEFEDFIALSKQLRKEKIESSLFEHNQRYFLTIKISRHHPRQKDILAIVLEYGEESAIDKLVLQEYGQLIMSQNALETARKYFKR